MTVTLTRRAALVLALVVAAVLAAYLLGSARPSAAASVAPSAASGSPTTGITVTGVGTVTGTPDTLTVSMSATATAKTIEAALAQANKAQAAVVFALKNNGVDPQDLQTSNVNIQPNYTTKGLPSGYVVSEGITAKVHGLSKAGATLSAAVAAGGDNVRVDGVYVAIDDTDPLKGDARASAIKDARQRAEQYAAAAGVRVGAVQTISEVVTVPAYNYAMPTAAYADRAAQSIPIQAGSQDVTVTVTVTYGVA
jgi:uncharacterized protein YggE